jgi:hypothetical protein
MTAQALGTNQFSFGSGFLYGIPLQGSTSQQNPTLLGTLQDVSYDITSSTKELYGQLQFPVAIGRGPAKFTGKAKMGNFSAQIWNTFFFGPGLSGGAYPVSTSAAVVTIFREGTAGTGTLIPATPFQVTAAALASPGGTFDTDLGVYFGTAGNNPNAGEPLQKVTGTPATQQYSVSAAGVYTFASADHTSGYGVFLSYTYAPTTASRWIQSINNSDYPMGAAPVFEIVHYIPYTTGGTDVTLKIYSAISNKLTIDFKNDNFSVPDIDFTMFANSAGKVLDVITFS